MRLSNVITLAIGLHVSVQATGISDSCGAAITVFVTAPPVTTFITLNTAPIASAAAVDISALKDNLDIMPLQPTTISHASNGDKTTHKTYLTYTHVDTVSLPTTSPVTKAPSDDDKTAEPADDKGPFFYAEQSGTTIWLNDKTPTATSGLVYGTTTIVISPVPSSKLESDSTSTTTTVIKKTSTRFITLTVTSTRATTSTSSSSRSKPAYGVYGWNTTASSLNDGFAKPENTAYQASATVSPSQTASSDYAPTGTLKSYRRSKAKRAGELWITATINGQVVSWINTSSRIPYRPTPVPLPAASPTQYTIHNLADLASLLDKLNNEQAASLDAIVAITQATASKPLIVSTSISTTISQPSETIATTDVANVAIAMSPSDTTTLSELAPTIASPAGGATSSSDASESVSASDVTSSDTVSVASTQAPTTVVRQLETVGTTSAVSSAAATPSSCGEFGSFLLNFEDLPDYSAGNDTTEYPPIFSPYHHLFFSDGFAYAPPPSDPYIPTSPPHLAIFVPSPAAVQDVADGPPDAPNAGYGSITAGRRASDSAYRFNVLSGNWGCQDAGPEDCTIHFHTFQWQVGPGSQMEVETSSASRPVSACPEQVNCTLTYFQEDDSWANLTSLRISAEVGGVPKNFFVDDLRLSWSDNSCQAGLRRQSSR